MDDLRKSVRSPWPSIQIHIGICGWDKERPPRNRCFARIRTGPQGNFVIDAILVTKYTVTYGV